jgi:hypothetical protein
MIADLHTVIVRLIIRAVLLALGIQLLAGCSTMHGEMRLVPVPTLPAGPVEMRVVHVINPRLTRMNAGQIQILLNAVKETCRQHFGVELTFTPVEEMSIEAFFSIIPESRRAEAKEYAYDFKSGKGDPETLGKEFGLGLRESGESLPKMIDYARPYLGEIGEQSYEALGAALARLQLERIRHWQTVPALDGGPAIDNSPYNEYTMWNLLGYGDLPFELVITNQIIASVESIDPSVHIAIRGGYNNGLTTYSRQSRFKTYSVWSTFAFTTDDPWVSGMRNGEDLNAVEAARLAGIGAAHELGHQLFHFLHPYDNIACVMNPVPMFSYRAWAEKLSPRDCPIGSSLPMTPGAFKFYY